MDMLAFKSTILFCLGFFFFCLFAVFCFSIFSFLMSVGYLNYLQFYFILSFCFWVYLSKAFLVIAKTISVGVILLPLGSMRSPDFIGLWYYPSGEWEVHSIAARRRRKSRLTVWSPLILQQWWWWWEEGTWVCYHFWDANTFRHPLPLNRQWRS